MEIIIKPLLLSIHGFSGIAEGKDYVKTAFGLSDRLWKYLRANHIKSKGQNIWVYESDHRVFAGVELEQEYPGSELERKVINLNRYAYHKHRGPYNQIRIAGDAMRNDIANQGLKAGMPYIEIYGHWTPDESKLETELFISLE